jgi:hypothetical protein
MTSIQTLMTKNMSRDLTLLSSATVSQFKVQEPLQTSKLQGEANLIKVNYRNEPGNSSASPLLTFRVRRR